jgi:hypothetical protein
MTSAGKVIRDFIYVDVERLYSLYSQVFEGVADQIIQSYMDASSRTKEQSEGILKGGSIEAQVAEMSRRTENRFLYDHMYNLFEAEIRHAILESPEVSSSNFREVLSQAFMIKVRGPAEVEDYNRLRIFMAKFNDIGEAIAYAGVISAEVSEAITELENTVTQIKDRNKRAKATERMKRQTDKQALAHQRAKELGLLQDEQNLKNLDMFSDLFNPEGFDITIVPEQGSDNVTFRGAVDKRWLRIQPDLLRSLYGGYVESNWTMVGQVTYLPGVQLPATGAGRAITDEDDPDPSMRDPYRNMFRSARVFERMFLESKERIEVIVYPLAIYREMLLPAAS